MSANDRGEFAIRVGGLPTVTRKVNGRLVQAQITPGQVRKSNPSDESYLSGVTMADVQHGRPSGFANHVRKMGSAGAGPDVGEHPRAEPHNYDNSNWHGTQSLLQDDADLMPDEGSADMFMQPSTRPRKEYMDPAVGPRKRPMPGSESIEDFHDRSNYEPFERGRYDRDEPVVSSKQAPGYDADESDELLDLFFGK